MATAALDDYYLYRKTTSTDLITLVSPTTLLGNAANAVSALTNIGFTFNFNNTDYTQFSVSSQGYVELGGAAAFYWEPSNITDVNTQVLLCPWWDDLRTSTDGVRYELFGSGPDRYLVIEFHSRAYYSYTVETIRHQVVLYETSNNVEFRYEYSSPFSGVVGNSAVIGCKVDTTSAVDGNFRDFFGTNGVAESNPNGGWSVVEAGIPNHSLNCNDGNDYPGDPSNTEEGTIFYFLFSPAAEAAAGLFPNSQEQVTSNRISNKFVDQTLSQLPLQYDRATSHQSFVPLRLSVHGPSNLRLRPASKVYKVTKG